MQLHSPLFVLAEHSGDDDHGQHAHADIGAQYSYSCATPARLESMEVMLFELFPGSEKLILQAITPRGQQGSGRTASSNRVRF